MRKENHVLTGVVSHSYLCTTRSVVTDLGEAGTNVLYIGI